MKKIIMAALAGALGMFLIIFGIAAVSVSREKAQEPTAYVHVDYVSELTQEDCFLCGNGREPMIAHYWGEDNVGIINLNTFELMRLEINRYDDYGQLIKEAAGYMQTSHLSGEDTYAHAYTHPDNGYSHVQITGVQYSIDRESVQVHLCQSCLDTINDLWYSEDAPAEYAIVSFAERTIQPLMKCYPWFSAGNYGIDCEFKDNGAIDLLIHYCPNRYE